MMAITTYARTGVDQIYQWGPESLVKESQVIVAGKITHYSKVVNSTSQGEPIPLIWTASGQIEQPVVIKGAVSTLPILFSKVERVVFLPSDPYLPNWLSDYGKLKPEGSVVLFFQGATDKPPSTVLPGGDNPDSQFALLKGIASIQAIGDPQEQADA
ncbi:MAG: hypothetical protein DM484_28810 [Candidatus Methylumidiphilus alinenensis]|uniref:Uncharacterized protein n=1 Tax=Candidatus Methylumidiphilus alinenensis TaxID=2202197 RepID=A0A2W4SEC7_9GAMM|nr:MAG: hypothetical protein DM484_28810 [Candidatus Methylumidiphilus alinenensis]